MTTARAALLAGLSAVALAAAPAALAQVTILKGTPPTAPAPGPAAREPTSPGPAIHTPGGGSSGPGIATPPSQPGMGAIPGGPLRPLGGGALPPGGGTVAPKDGTTVAEALAQVAPLAADAAGALAAALKASDEPRCDEARAAAKATRVAILAKYVEWSILRQPKNDAGFAEAAAFLRGNPDWPDDLAIRRAAEDKLGVETAPRDQLAWFEAFPPLTSAGIMRRMEAAEAAAPAKVAAFAQESWRVGTFRNADEISFLARYGQHLRPDDHLQRFNRLLREGKDKVARDLVPKLAEDDRKVAEARLALQQRAPEATVVLRAVPAARQGDGRLLLDRVRFLRRSNDLAGARALLLSLPADLRQDDDWWTERQSAARDSLQANRAEEAYRLVSAHGLTPRGIAFAEAEFLAGWIALRWLKKPDEALKRFQTLEENVATALSKSRAAYWIGRAHEAAKRAREAQAAYEKGAQFSHTFYGQLAARKLPGGALRYTPDPVPTALERDSVEKREIVAVARWLRQIGEDERARPFLLRVGRLSQSAGEIGLSATIALDMGRPDVALAIARRGAEAGIVLTEAAFPVVDMGSTGSVERALALGLARQESAFSTSVVSPAGAMGLMQLMPGTARQVAQKLGQPYDQGRLLRDPAYNVALGSHYFSEMLEKFGGSYELALSAYNAGPARTARWLDTIGDPRTGAIDMVDWIELIPFRETRNYVQRVMEAVVVYRDRLNGPFRAVPAPRPR